MLLLSAVTHSRHLVTTGALVLVTASVTTGVSTGVPGYTGALVLVTNSVSGQLWGPDQWEPERRAKSLAFLGKDEIIDNNSVADQGM